MGTALFYKAKKQDTLHRSILPYDWLLRVILPWGQQQPLQRSYGYTS